ncbi:MAG: hypothetical protein ACOCQR_00570 [bacterium]
MEASQNITKNYHLLIEKFNLLEENNKKIFSLLKEEDEKKAAYAIKIIEANQIITNDIDRIEENLKYYLKKNGINLSEAKLNINELVKKIKTIEDLTKKNNALLLKNKSLIQEEYEKIKNKKNVKQKYEQSVNMQRKKQVNIKS